MLKHVLSELMSGSVLSENEAYNAMQQVLTGEATPSQISAMITIITYRDPHTSELIGFTKAMRDHAVRISYKSDEPILDTCGTGGTGTKTFNVSTASAIVASSTGLKVAKHGNRSVTSASGSADVLEQLHIPVDHNPDHAVRSLTSYHMCFMFAPLYHQAMKHAAATRKEIGFRSVFNLLGPMTNPAGARHQVIGVFDANYSVKIAETLRALGSSHVLIVAGADGLDECTVGDDTFVTELKEGEITQYKLAPEDVGLRRFALEQIQVSDPQQSAAIILDVLKGSNRQAAYDMVCYNAGAALYVGQKAPTLKEGVQLAKEQIHSGQAYAHLVHLQQSKEEAKNA